MGSKIEIEQKLHIACLYYSKHETAKHVSFECNWNLNFSYTLTVTLQNVSFNALRNSMVYYNIIIIINNCWYLSK